MQHHNLQIKCGFYKSHEIFFDMREQGYGLFLLLMRNFVLQCLSNMSRFYFKMCTVLNIAPENIPDGLRSPQNQCDFE